MAAEGRHRTAPILCTCCAESGAVKRTMQEPSSRKKRSGGRVRGLLSRLVRRKAPSKVPPAAELSQAHALWGYVPAYNYVNPDWFGRHEGREDD